MISHQYKCCRYAICPTIRHVLFKSQIFNRHLHDYKLPQSESRLFSSNYVSNIGNKVKEKRSFREKNEEAKKISELMRDDKKQYEWLEKYNQILNTQLPADHESVDLKALLNSLKHPSDILPQLLSSNQQKLHEKQHNNYQNNEESKTSKTLKDSDGQSFSSSFPFPLPKNYFDALKKWAQSNLFPQSDHPLAIDPSSIHNLRYFAQTFIHPSYVVKYWTSEVMRKELSGKTEKEKDESLQIYLSKHSNKELVTIGSTVLKTLVSNYLTWLFKNDSSKTDLIAPSYLPNQSLDEHDIVDTDIIANENINNLQNKFLKYSTLRVVSQHLQLPLFLLSKLEITERPEGQEVVLEMPFEPEQLLTKRERRRRELSHKYIPDALVFETDKYAALNSYAPFIEVELLEALIGALYRDCGMECVAWFFVEKLLPIISLQVSEPETINFVEKVETILRGVKAVPEYKCIDERKFRKHQNVRVGLFVNEKLIASSFAETYVIAKQLAAKNAYIILTKNDLKLNQIKELSKNIDYMHSLKLVAK